MEGQHFAEHTLAARLRRLSAYMLGSQGQRLRTFGNQAGLHIELPQAVSNTVQLIESHVCRRPYPGLADIIKVSADLRDRLARLVAGESPLALVEEG